MDEVGGMRIGRASVQIRRNAGHLRTIANDDEDQSEARINRCPTTRPLPLLRNILSAATDSTREFSLFSMKSNQTPDVVH